MTLRTDPLDDVVTRIRAIQDRQIRDVEARQLEAVRRRRGPLGWAIVLGSVVGAAGVGYALGVVRDGGQTAVAPAAAVPASPAPVAASATASAEPEDEADRRDEARGSRRRQKATRRRGGGSRRVLAPAPVRIEAIATPALATIASEAWSELDPKPRRHGVTPVADERGPRDCRDACEQDGDPYERGARGDARTDDGALSEDGPMSAGGELAVPRRNDEPGADDDA